MKFSTSELNVKVDGLKERVDRHGVEADLHAEKVNNRFIKVENDIKIVQLEARDRVSDAMIKIAGMSAVLAIIVSLVVGVAISLVSRQMTIVKQVPIAQQNESNYSQLQQH